jgi:hypothetical protein
MPPTPRNNSVDSIVNYFSEGFQRSNRFQVVINNSVDFWATSVQIPEQSVTYYPETFGPSSPLLHIPLKRGYDERLLVEFIVDKNWNVRKYFETWLDSMFSSIDSNKSSAVAPRNLVTRTIQINALSDTPTAGGIVPTNAKFILYEAYPKLILPSEMSNDSPNQYLSMVVDFNYRYYKFYQGS